MLVVSPHGRPVYWLGDYAGHRFSPEGSPKRLDWGDVFYAPNSLRDPDGRWLMWGWIREARPRGSICGGRLGILSDLAAGNFAG